MREIYKRKNDIVIIDEVPTFVCNHCGEKYFLSEVSKKMRAIAEIQ
ncbi:MAG: YgiT-type zinc finger protein [bacterium]